MAQDVIHDLKRLLSSVPIDKRGMVWVHRICNITRLVHIDVWQQLHSRELVNEQVIPLLQYVRETLISMLSSRSLTESEKELLRVHCENVTARIQNVKENYLNIKPSDFLPDSKLRDSNLHVLYEDREEPSELIEIIHFTSAELIKYLKKHPDALYPIRPRQFEEIIAEILASYGWEVQLTPATKDGGYDIFAISKDIKAGVRSSWIVECKKYRPENKVGVDIVRALYGVKSNLKIANALIATTSCFTKGARDFKESRYDIELKDYQDILEWINQYRPNPDGTLYIRDNKLVLPDGYH